MFPIVAEHVKGFTASGLNEARMCAPFDRPVHVHAPAYAEDEIDELAAICDTVVFNSAGQFRRFAARVGNAAIRVRAARAFSPSPKYDTSGKVSRFGATAAELAALPEATILHVHGLCEGTSGEFAEYVRAFTAEYADSLPRMRFINLGGGMDIAAEDFVTDDLKRALDELRSCTPATLQIEPCECVTASCGRFETTVLDVFDRGDVQVAIIDASAACHAPDVINMPYVPELDFPAGDKRVLLGGISCLACDVFGEYRLARPLVVGERLAFRDAGAYTFAQVNDFNGVRRPATVIVE